MGSAAARSALILKSINLETMLSFLPVIQRLVNERVFDQPTLWTTPVAAPLYEPLLPHLRLKIIAREAFYPAWKNPTKLLALSRQVRIGCPDLALVAEDMGNTAYFSGAGFWSVPAALASVLPISRFPGQSTPR